MVTQVVASERPIAVALLRRNVAANGFLHAEVNAPETGGKDVDGLEADAGAGMDMGERVLCKGARPIGARYNLRAPHTRSCT